MELNIVYGDDWQGLYVNNLLLIEGHHLDVFEVLSKLKEEYPEIQLADVYISEYWCDNDWLEDESFLPNNFEEVKLS